jgi:acylphosphatase
MIGDARPATSRVAAVVHGVVQGVGFRWFVQQMATRLDLVGWTANRPDGSVEVVVEGPSDDVEAFVEALHSGPPGALVSHVDVRPELPLGRLTSFDIRSGAHRGD